MDQKMQILSPIMSSEEAKIRDELEMDIENDLEQEIKDGIYHLALRLHRLYRHRNERQNEKRRKKMVSEVNISIKLEGGTKIEIKESKKQTPDPENCRPRTARSSADYSNTKRFDWERSLRSSSDSMSTNRNNVRSHEQNINLSIDNGRGNLTSSAGPKKVLIKRYLNWDGNVKN